MRSDDLALKLENVKGSGNQRNAKCPAHDDAANSLSFSDGDDRILVNCFAGCSFEAIVAALSLKPADMFFNNGKKTRGVGGSAPIGQERDPVTGVTLEAISKAKHLPPDFLKKFGCWRLQAQRSARGQDSLRLGSW